MRSTLRRHDITLVHATLNSPDSWGYIFDISHAEDHFAYQFTKLCFCGHSHVPAAFIRKITPDGKHAVAEIPKWARKPGEGIVPDRIQEADELSVKLEPSCRYLFNIGSVGQPRNRDPRSSFAVLDTEKQLVTRYRIPYPIWIAQEKIRKAGLPERLAARLELGN